LVDRENYSLRRAERNPWVPFLCTTGEELKTKNEGGPRKNFADIKIRFPGGKEEKKRGN